MSSPHPAHRLQRPSPAIVSQAAVWRLPRWALWSVCLVYSFTGFVLREPWKSPDIIALGLMQAMAEGRSTWLHPVLGDFSAPAFTWLPYWLGALSIKLCPSFVPLDLAARLPFIALLLLAFTAVWYSTYFLSREPAAQPLPFALGGEAQPIDYARTVADGSLLALMATLGLAQIGHEATASLVRFAFVALWLYSLTALRLYPQKSRWAAVFASLGLAFSGAPGLLLLLALVGAACVHWGEYFAPRPPRTARDLGFIVGTALIAATLSFLLQSHEQGLTATMGAWKSGFHHRPWDASARLLAWFLWPSGLMALIALWSWRAWWRSPHILLPSSMAAVCIGFIFFKNEHDRALLLATPALAVLAAMYLPTMRRTVSAWVDWFTLLFFSVCGLAIWVVWLSLETGWPPQPARNVERLLPNLVYHGSLWDALIALVATLAWLRLILWRVGRDRSALWKSLALPAGGAALCWLLLLTLWFPLLNFARSYENMMQRIGQRTNNHHTLSSSDTPENAAHCVYYYRLEPEHLAALYFYRPLQPVAYRPVPANMERSERNPSASSLPHQSQECTWFLLEEKEAGRLPDLVGEQLWFLKSRVLRSADHKDFLLLYQRVEN